VTVNLPQMPVRDASGRIRYDREAEPSKTFVAAVGTTMTEATKRIMEITEADPQSGRIMFDRVTRFQRDDWDCTIQFGADLTSTAEEFHLKEWVIARKGEVEIFRRETPSVIKRELL
jgi:hypothetical protein